MQPQINTSGAVAACLAGAGAVVTFATTIGVPKERLWIAAAIGAAIAFVGWIVPQHVYHAPAPTTNDKESSGT